MEGSDSRLHPADLSGQRVGKYEVQKKLGEGGMGTVWAARDVDLLREVALKVVREEKPGRDLRERFMREARAAAAVNHAGICQVYDAGEDRGILYIAMELLEGETLAERLERGAIPAPLALSISEGILTALSALHARGLVHRDMKPSNVFLLRLGGVKLLDFGLVRPVSSAGGSAPLTEAGAVIGTPAYMAPEQVQGSEVDARTDLFSAAAILFEMLTGRAVFRRASIGETLAAVLRDEPPPLPEPLSGWEGVLRPALSKNPKGRPVSAAAFLASLLQSASGAVPAPGGGSDKTWVISGSPTPPSRGPATPSPVSSPAALRPRLAVIPFRLLRPDPDIDFLSFSLADAVAQSLSSHSGISVRSVLAAAPFAVPAPDLAALSQKLDVTLALFGTILKAGGRCRVSAQLLEVPSGQLISSHTSEASADDVFGLQDALTQKIVGELHLPSEKGTARPDVPGNPDAYELYLRANQAVMWSRDLSVAKGLYRGSLELDSAFAPAWARLARCYHMDAKYGDVVGRAENSQLADEALKKALSLNPDLAMAHRLRALMDVENGRAEEAVERLLGIVSRNPGDPEGWAGLVTALRFLGLLPESLAAHRRARALDPHVPTSAFHTYFSLGDVPGMLSATTNSPYERALGFKIGGRTEDALSELRREPPPAQGLAREWWHALYADLTGDAPSAIASARRLLEFPDPEGRYYIAFIAARLDPHLSIQAFRSAVFGGYVNVPAFERERALDGLRTDPGFAEAFDAASVRHGKARARFGGSVA